MNKTILIGRLTKAPELTYTPSNIAVCKFTLAVDRRFKSEGQPQADFINCVAWRQTAEFITKYFGKGNKLAAVGSIQVRTWDKDGQKHYLTEVVVDEVEFVEGKKESTEVQPITDPVTGKKSDTETFIVLDDDDGDCPF